MTLTSSLGTVITYRVKKLQARYLNGESTARAQLAQLRRSVGKPPGSVPEIWELTVGSVPERLSGTRDTPNTAERATHAALTLYAVHQQSRPRGMHVPGRSFGAAVRMLSRDESASSDAVTRRFMAVATAESMDEVLVHVRGLITQLRSRDIGLDYGRFTDDLANLLTPGRETGVRLAWGRDYYRTQDPEDETTDQGNGTDDKEADQ